MMDCIMTILTWLESKHTCIAAIANIFVCLSAIFVGYQARLLSKDYKSRNKKEEFENSFRLTEFYINNIIPKMTILLMVFRRTGVEKAIGKQLKGADIRSFDKEEFNDYFEDLPFKKIESMINSASVDILLECFCDISQENICDLRLRYKEYLDKFNDNEEMLKTHSEIFRKQLLYKVWTMISDVCNGLEYFAMYFNSNLAKDEVVYDSLHQTYTDFVRMLYPFIARHNTQGEFTRKYYTNTSELYNKWVNKETQTRNDTFEAVAGVGKRSEKDRKL